MTARSPLNGSPMDGDKTESAKALERLCVPSSASRPTPTLGQTLAGSPTGNLPVPAPAPR